MPPITILFICTGNICRSPLAEAVARHTLTAHFQVADLKFVGLHVSSAGTHALAGHRATPEMQKVAAEMGLDLAEHRAGQIGVSALAEASLVYAMEMSHVDWLQSHLLRRQISLLGNAGIADPYGSDLFQYRRAAQEIVTAVEMRVPEIIALVG